MKPLIARLGNLLVMLHMTLGCNWHHGIHQACTCNKQSTTTSASFKGSKNHRHESDCESGHVYCSHRHSVHRQIAKSGNAKSGHHRLIDSGKHLESFQLVEVESGELDNEHSTCQHDGCHYQEVYPFDLLIDQHCEFSSCINETGEISLTSALRYAADQDISATPQFSSADLRAHLALCVQII